METDNVDKSSHNSPFTDEIGKEVIKSFEKLEEDVNQLTLNLENQFGDGDDDVDNRLDPISLQDDSLKSVKEQMDEIIDILNDQSTETSEDENYHTKKNHSIEKEDTDSYEEYSNEEDGDDESYQERHEGRASQDQSLSNKIFDLINALQNREVPVKDEWDNDDDSGYITITLTDQEFFEYEDRNAAKIVAKRNAARDEMLKEKDKLSSSPSKETSDNADANVTEESKADIEKEILEEKAAANFETIIEPKAAEFTSTKRQSVGERRRSEIMGQHRFQGADGMHCFFNLKVIFEPFKTGFEESKDLKHPKGTIIAGRYEVYDVLGSAAFSTALQCIDLAAEEDEAQWVCLKVIKNNKDYFDQSLDEIKLLQYINSRGEPDDHHVLRLIDFFYCKEHLFIVSELLKENLYEFGRYIRENDLEVYYTLPRLKKISKQVLEALNFIHSLKLIHCDVKPENIVIKSFSRCEIKLIDFGSSCFTTDHLTTYIQSRSYRAPEVILGHHYDSRIDIWSVGAVIAELYTGYVLFQNDSVPTMLSRITGILGTFPEHVLSNGRDTGKYFTLSNIVYERDDEGSFHLIFPKKTNLRSRLHMDKPVVDLESLSEEERQQMKDEDLFVDFVGQLLHLDPEKRLTASQALKHPWLSDADEAKFTEYIIGQPATQQKEPLPDDDDDDNDGFEEDDDQEDDDAEFEEEGYNEEVYINNQDDEESENADIGEIAISIEEELNNFENSKE